MISARLAGLLVAGCGRVGFDSIDDAPVQDSLVCADPVLDDKFDDDVVDSTLWLSGPASSEMQGALSIVPAGLSNYFGLSTVMPYDFRNRYVGVTFAEVPPSGSSGAVGIRTKVAAEQDFTYAEVRDQLLSVGTYTPINPNPFLEIAYDPIAHRFIRMRETGDRVYWEASATGDAWTPLADGPSPALIRNAALWVYAYDVGAPLDVRGRVDRVVVCPN